MALFVISGVEIASNLEINVLYMISNRLGQLPHARGIFFIYDTSLTLDGGRWSQVWDLRQIP